VQSFPASGAKWQISVSGGTQARWGRDGKELFYLSGERRITSVEANTEAATFTHGTPKTRLDTPILRGEDHPGTQYVVSADGRLLVNTVPEERPDSPISVMVNWTAVLKK
jgi:hypothetical protein